VDDDVWDEEIVTALGLASVQQMIDIVCTLGEEAAMGKDAPARKRKNFRLPQSKLDAARRILGTKTETETIERALDLVAFGERLARGTEGARGLPWTDALGERES
jgi:hypothetical protein